MHGHYDDLFSTITIYGTCDKFCVRELVWTDNSTIGLVSARRPGGGKYSCSWLQDADPIFIIGLSREKEAFGCSVHDAGSMLEACGELRAVLCNSINKK